MNPTRNSAAKALGLTELHAATILGRTRRVRALLASDNKKQLIEARDAEGTTPLMAAVLTGRLAIAKLLLRNMASSKAKDRKGYRALEHAKASLFKKKLSVYHRLGLPHISTKQRRQRLAIAKILRYPAARRSSQRVGNDKYSNSFFFKRGEMLQVLAPSSTFKIAKQGLERATTGFIVSVTDSRAKAAAVSGWQPNPARGADVLENVKYTKLVRDVARFLGFELTPSHRDNNARPLPEHKGRFVASHVEKKLAVFWTIAACWAALRTTDYKRMGELQKSHVPVGFREAVIYLDHGPCSDCLRFLDKIRRVTGIRILFETRPFLTKGQREGAPGCRNCHCERCVRVHKGDLTSAAEFDGPPATNNNTDGESTDSEPEAVDPSPQEPTVPVSGDVDKGSQPRQSRGQAIQQPSQPPSRWKVFESQSGKPCAKPIPRAIRDGKREEEIFGAPATPRRSAQSPDSRPQTLQARSRSVITTIEGHNELTETQTTDQRPSSGSTPDFIEPASTMAGRSGFFETPEPRAVSKIEVQLPNMSPGLRAEYDRVPEIPQSRSQAPPLRFRSQTPGPVYAERINKKRKKTPVRTMKQATTALNLKRFAYSGLARGSPAPTISPRTKANTGSVQKRVAGGKSAKAAGKKPRNRANREALLRSRSTFARAVEHRQRLRGGNRDA